MATQTQIKNDSEDVQQKVQECRQLFVDAPELGKKALENVLREIKPQLADTPPPSMESVGGVGTRLGKVSELTIIVQLAPSGAHG